jgi:tetratricopeptide (TPR) repeat protein
MRRLYIRLISGGALWFAASGSVAGAAPAPPVRDAVARYRQALIQARAGATSAAIATLESLTRAYPRLAEPHRSLAALYADAGAYARAAAELSAALALANEAAAPAARAAPR